MDRLREMAAERIGWLVELVLGEEPGGLDLAPWLGSLGAVDELAGAMASGMPAAVRVASPPGGAPASGAAAYDAGALGGVGASGGQASGFAGGTGDSSAFSAARDAAWGSAGEFLTLDDDYNPNFPPYAFGEGYLTTHDCTLEVYAPGILENDWDPDGDDIYAVLVTGPSDADYFSLASDGSFTYTPVGGFVGEDGFTYQVSDGVNLSEETATCTIGVFNCAPVVEDDIGEYLTGHDCALEVSDESGVLANDFDPDGDPMTAVLETGPSHAAAFSLNPGGGFYYEPEYHWVGADTFTYRATDGLAASELATVEIGVMNMSPMAVDDGPYETDATTSLKVDAPGVLENDWDEDGDPVTAVLDTGPLHGTLDYFHSDGSFKYTPSGTYAGTDTFTYYAHDGLANSETPATVQIDVFPDHELTIYYGNSAAAVPDDLEESVGAFTVANLNDTDGDGQVDAWDEDGVIATAQGENEVDLMQLVIHKPVPDLGGSVWLTVSDPTTVRLWEEPTKVNEIVMDMYGELEFSTSELPKTLWVELTSPSNWLRDVQISTNYQEYGGDTVTATGVWASLTACAYGDASYADLIMQAPWCEVVPGQDPQPLMEDIGGTGLRPVPTEVFGVDSVLNSMWMCFTVSPPGIQEVQYVSFDVTRRVETRVWKLDAQKSVIPPAVHEEDFPPKNEEANDDAVGETDESDEPNANQHMFAVDAPGPTHAWLLPGPQYCVSRFNAEEFVRFAYGVTVEGNGWQGSRCSGKFEWHVNHTLQDDGSGHWMRDATGVNDVGPGPLNVPVDDSNPWDDP